MAKKIRIIQSDPSRGVYGQEDTPFLYQIPDDYLSAGIQSLSPGLSWLLNGNPAPVSLRRGARGIAPSAVRFLAGDTMGMHPAAVPYQPVTAPGISQSGVDFQAGALPTGTRYATPVPAPVKASFGYMGLQPSAEQFVTGALPVTPHPNPYDNPSLYPQPAEQPQSAIDFLSGALGKPPAPVDYNSYPAVDRPMTAATREERLAAQNLPVSLPPDRQMPMGDVRSGIATQLPPDGTVSPEGLTQDWQVPASSNLNRQQPLEPTQNAYPLPPEGTVAGQDVTPPVPPAQSAIDFLSGALGKPPAPVPQTASTASSPPMIEPRANPPAPGSVDAWGYPLEPNVPTDSAQGNPIRMIPKEAIPGIVSAAGRVVNPIMEGAIHVGQKLWNRPPSYVTGPVNAAEVAARPPPPPGTKPKEVTLGSFGHWLAGITGDAIEAITTKPEAPKPGADKPKEQPAKDAQAAAPGSTTVGGVTVTPGGGVSIDPPAVAAQTQAGQGTKDIQSMIETLFPPLDQSNPKQDIADANAQRQMQRDALLAQMAMGAGIASGAGQSWAGIAKGGFAAAAMYDEGFKRYQSALQDSADRYAESQKTGQAYETAKRSAVASLLTKQGDTELDRQKFAFEVYKNRREEAMSLFKPWLAVLEKSDPLMGGPDLQAQQSAIANAINTYMTTGKFFEPHWQTQAPA